MKLCATIVPVVDNGAFRVDLSGEGVGGDWAAA